MTLPFLIIVRLVLHAGLAVLLLTCGGTPTARYHARIMAVMCGATAACGWVPASGTAWWRMRAAYLAVACGCCVAWGWVLTRRER